MGLFDKFFSLFKKKKDKEPPTDEKEKNKPDEIEEISENIPKPEPIGAAKGIIASAPEFSKRFAIKGSSLQ